MSASADPRQAERVADLYRQVRAIVDRVRPLHDSYMQLKGLGGGEKADALWRVMSAEEQEEVKHFTKYVEASEELRQGRMPSLAALPAALQKQQARGPVGAAPKVGATVATRTQQSKRHRRGAGRAAPQDDALKEEEEQKAEDHHEEEAAASGEDDDDAQADAEEEEEEAITVDMSSLKTPEEAADALFSHLTADARERILVAFVEQRMSESSTASSELAAAEDKLNAANDLKKRIVSGSLKKPSKAQMAEVEQIAALKKDVTRARKKVEREELQLRTRVLELLEALEASSSDDSAAAAEEEEQAEVEAEEKPEKTPARAPTAEAEQTEKAEEEEEVVQPAARATTTITSTAATTATASREPEQAQQGEGEDAPKEEEAPAPASEGVKVAEASEPEAEEDATADVAAAAEPEHEEPEEAPEEEEQQPPPEEEAAPAAPVPTSITGFTEGNDWHKLVYRTDGFTMDVFRSLVRRPEKTAAEAAEAEEAEKEDKEEGEEAPKEVVVPSIPQFAEDKRAHYTRHQLGVEDHVSAGAAAAASGKESLAGSGNDTDSNADEDEDEGSEGDATLAAAAKAEGLPVSMQECLAREWLAVGRFPVPRVVVRRAGPSTWHVAVSPLDGPFCGVPLHLTVRFPTSYPFTSPKVRADVALPHPALMVSSTGETNTLFLTYTGGARNAATTTTTMAAGTPVKAGWQPDYGIHAVLLELQNMFNASGFASMATALGEEAFAAQIHEARSRMARFMSTCPCCATSSRGEYVNGPLLSADVTATTTKDTEADADDGDDGECTPSSTAATGASLAEPKAADGWLPAGPSKQVWAHLLLSGPCGSHNTFHLCVQSRGVPLGQLNKTSQTVRVCEVTREAAFAGTANLTTASTAWATALLRGDSSAASSTFAWTSQGSAWHTAQRLVPHKKEAAAAEEVCELLIDIVNESANGAEVVGNNTDAATRVTLPAASDVSGQRLFAVVLESLADQSLSFQVSQGAVAHAFPAVATLAGRTVSESLEATWPATAFYLDPSTADQDTADNAVTTTTGLLIELPYLQTPDAAASGQDATYYTPHSIRFHLRDSQVPLVLSESAYLSHRRLILTRRRRRDGTFPPIEDGAPRDDYLASATEDVLRRALNLDDPHTNSNSNGGGRVSSAVEANKYFWGLRAVFIPLTRSWGRDGFGRTHALDRLKRTAIQIYRHPAASVVYHPPFRPLQMLHLLALVMHGVLRQATSAAATTSRSPSGSAAGDAGMYARLCEELERTTLDLSADSPAFLRLCVDLVDQYVRGATEDPLDTSDAIVKPAGGLFLQPPFMPRLASSLTTIAPADEQSASAKELSAAAMRLGESDVAQYLAQESAVEVTALFLVATVVVARGTKEAPMAAGGVAQAAQARLMARAGAKAVFLRRTLTTTAKTNKTAKKAAETTAQGAEAYVYTGAMPDTACAHALATLLHQHADSEL